MGMPVQFSAPARSLATPSSGDLRLSTSPRRCRFAGLLLAEAAYDTSEAAVAPTLATLLHTFPHRLEEATEEANDRLSAELEKLGGPQIVKVALELRGRELTSEAQLEALLREIEDRLRAQLKQGRRVRLT